LDARDDLRFKARGVRGKRRAQFESGRLEYRAHKCHRFMREQRDAARERQRNWNQPKERGERGYAEMMRARFEQRPKRGDYSGA
jgi:hypothetical protein